MMHLYFVPQCDLVRLPSINSSDEDKVVLLPPFDHVTFGLGLPVALQNKTALLPSTVVVFKGATTISGASSQNKTSNQWPRQLRLNVHLSILALLSVFWLFKSRKYIQQSLATCYLLKKQRKHYTFRYVTKEGLVSWDIQGTVLGG